MCILDCHNAIALKFGEEVTTCDAIEFLLSSGCSTCDTDILTNTVAKKCFDKCTATRCKVLAVSQSKRTSPASFTRLSAVALFCAVFVSSFLI